jgi:hypothetical protein
MGKEEEAERITEALAKAAAAEVRVFKVQPGDVLHVRVGIEDMGDGIGPWIPTPDEVDHVKEEVEAHLPDGVTAYVTHFGVYIDAQVSDG